MGEFQIQPIFQLVRGAANRGALIESLQAVPVGKMDRAQLDVFLSDARKVERALAQVDTEGAKRFAVAINQLRSPSVFKDAKDNRRIALALLVKAFARAEDPSQLTRFAKRETVAASLTEALRRHRSLQPNSAAVAP